LAANTKERHVHGGLGFIFYHFFYFYAFSMRHRFEAGLIATFGPLLIVLNGGE